MNKNNHVKQVIIKQKNYNFIYNAKVATYSNKGHIFERCDYGMKINWVYNTPISYLNGL